MGRKDGRPFAIAVNSIPVAMHFSLRPGLAFADTQEHLAGVQQADERAKWTGESPENEHRLADFRLMLDVFDRSKDSRMLEEKRQETHGEGCPSTTRFDP
ncbi:hypothetical protein [Bradyrhizobium ottawaense]|uniref:hypothetical protein n=1 Tax=Bradyrhizobium ottawaense TaxID=931866 RepID=UPI00384ADDDF